MIKHFLIPSTLIILAAMSSCSPNDDKLNNKYTDQLAPGTLTNAELRWTTSAPGDANGGGKIILMRLGANSATVFNVPVTPQGDNIYSYTASGTTGFLNINIGQLLWVTVGGAYMYGQDFTGVHYGGVEGIAKTFFSRSFFGGNDYRITPFRINFLSFNGFQGYKAEILVPRGAVWAGQFQNIAQQTVTIPLDITFTF